MRPFVVFQRLPEPRGPQPPPAEARRIRLSPGVPRRLRSEYKHEFPPPPTSRIENRQKRKFLRTNQISMLGFHLRPPGQNGRPTDAETHTLPLEGR